MKRVRSLITLIALSACATTGEAPTWDAPKVVPKGWIVDYDYGSNLKMYLRRQHDSARLEGATAYVYLFSDRSAHCRRIRSMLRDKAVRAAFRESRITMLNYDRLKWLHQQNPEDTFNPGRLAPLIIKISMAGDLSGAYVNPDLQVFHQTIFPEQKPGKPNEIVRFADVMQQFFQANNEI